MDRAGSRGDATGVTRVVIIGGYLLMLAANLPGHLSTDSVLALHEGRFHVRETWGPAIYAWLLGLFDSVVPGAGLYVVLSGLMLFGAWLWLVRLKGQVSWLAPAVALVVVLTPNVLIYQGIVWKDVLFANAATLGFVCLAGAAARWEAARRPWVALGAAALLMAVAALVRQNGLVIWLPAAAAIAWSLRARGWRTVAAWSLGWLALVAVVTQVLAVTALPQGPGKDTATAKGVRIVQHYDIAGAVARDPTLALAPIDRVDPDGDDYLRANAGRVYSPERIDTLNADPEIGAIFWGLPDDAVRDTWLDIIVSHPGIYLRERFAAFRWVLASPVIERCLPVYVGVDGPPPQLAELNMAAGRDLADMKLYNYSTWFMATPVMSHLAYAVLAVAVALLLLWRRRASDVPMAAMLIGALMFVASFFVISIACDYRYLYFLDIAALTGLFYLSLDPRVWRRTPI